MAENRKSGSGRQSTASSGQTRKKTNGNTGSAKSQGTNRNSTTRAGQTKAGDNHKTNTNKSVKGGGKNTSNTNTRTTRSNISSYTEEKNGVPYVREIVILVAAALCLMMFLGNFGLVGIIGKVLSIICMDLTGNWIGYIFPILLFAGFFYLIRRWYEFESWVKASGSLLVLFAICVILQTAAVDETALDGILPFNMVFRTDSTIGGLPAVLFAKMLYPIMGRTGIIICMVVLAVIGLLLITGKSIFELIENASDHAKESAVNTKAYDEKRAEERRLRREEIRRANAQNAKKREEEERIQKIRQQKQQALEERRRREEQQNGRLQENGAGDASSIRIIGGEKTSQPLDGNGTTAFERPQRAERRAFEGVTGNTGLKPNMPGDRQAVEFTSGEDSEELPVIQVTQKRGSRRTPKAQPKESPKNASDYVMTGGEMHAADLYVNKTDPNVVPPEPIVPVLKPNKGRRTASELKRLDGGDATPAYNQIITEDDHAAKGTLTEPKMPSFDSDAIARIPINSHTDRPQNESSEDLNGAYSSVDAADTFTQRGIYTVEHSESNPKSFEASNESAEEELQTEENSEPVYFETSQSSEPVLKPEDDPDYGYRVVEDANGRVIRARLNAVAGESELGPKESYVSAASEAEKVEILEHKASKPYEFPSIELLHPIKNNINRAENDADLRNTAGELQETLNIYGVNARVENISYGPVVTRYELKLERGVKVSKILQLQDDIKLALAVTDIRIEAPIPGKSLIGIEVPNKVKAMVGFRELLESREFKESKSKLTFAVGKDIEGHVIVTDIAKMPHLLIAGQTGSGKSVSVNTMILSILYKAKPDEVKLIMIDPKVVELSVYNDIPHLITPVVTDPKKACGALNWAVAEMENRYKLFAQEGVRELNGYNEKIQQKNRELGLSPEDKNYIEKKPQIVVIVDELADLMMVAGKEIEQSIARLAQKARAAGIYLIIATQRPSVNVITGLIKANVPSRIAFSVSQGVDSRTILDMQGAEKLLGKGDMLFYPAGAAKPVRVQGAFVSDEEVNAIVESIKNQGEVQGSNHDAAIVEHMNQSGADSEPGSEESSGPEYDELFVLAGRSVIERSKASVGKLQQIFRIGFNRGARIMDQLEAAGVVGPEEGTKPRKILMTREEFENFVEENGL